MKASIEMIKFHLTILAIHRCLSCGCVGRSLKLVSSPGCSKQIPGIAEVCLESALDTAHDTERLVAYLR